MRAAILTAYLASLTAATLATPVFFVVTAPMLVLYACMAALPVFALLSASLCAEKAMFVLFNVILALALYPPLIEAFTPDGYLERADQLQLLRQIANGAPAEHRLALALQSDRLFSLERQSPWLYYLSPGALVPLLWALAAYLPYPANNR